MSGFIKQTFIILVLVLLGFDGSLAIKCISKNNHWWMVAPTLIDLNRNKLHYYWFFGSIDGCDGSCNTAEHSFGRICTTSKIESI